MSTDRTAFCEEVAEVPWWKKFLRCYVTRRSETKLARPYTTIALHAFNKDGDFELFAQMRAKSDSAWSKVYDVELPT